MIQRILVIVALFLSAGIPQLTAADGPRIVFMIGEEEYHTWETLPDFAEKNLKPLGYRITIVNADAADKNQFPGIMQRLKRTVAIGG